MSVKLSSPVMPSCAETTVSMLVNQSMVRIVAPPRLIPMGTVAKMAINKRTNSATSDIVYPSLCSAAAGAGRTSLTMCSAYRTTISAQEMGMQA